MQLAGHLVGQLAGRLEAVQAAENHEEVGLRVQRPVDLWRCGFHFHHLMSRSRHVESRFRSQALNGPFSDWTGSRIGLDSTGSRIESVSTPIAAIKCSLENAWGAATPIFFS